jgi:hypothetical protein
MFKKVNKELSLKINYFKISVTLSSRRTLNRHMMYIQKEGQTKFPLCKIRKIIS